MKNQNTSRMSMADKPILVGIGLAALYWILEAAIHVFIFHEGTLIKQILSPGPHELWMRSIAMCIVITFGGYAQFVTTRRKRMEEELRAHRDHLEDLVKERTAELTMVNEQLRQEITERKQAEEALRESEERFRTIFETAQDSIFIKDRTLKYTQANPAMERLFGLPASKLIGLTDENLFGEEAGAHIREVDSRVLGGEIIEEEHTKPVKGVPHTFHVIKVPMRDSSGEIIGLCGIARDVTERKRAEEEIRAARDYLETLLGSLHDQVLVIDRDYRVSDVNTAFLRQMGYSREEVIGRHCYEVTHGRSEPCAGDGHPCPAQRVWESGQPARATHTHYDHQGKICWIAVAASPVRDAEGRVMRVIEAYRDVTGEHKLEEKLTAIHALEQELVLAADEERIAQAVVEAAERVLKFRMCGLWLVDEEGKELVRRAATAAGQAVDIPPLLLDGERGITVAVACSGETIYLPDVQQDRRYIEAGLESRSELCVPLKVGERVIGVLNVESEKLDAFDQADMQLLSTLADQAALAIKNARLFEEEERRVAQLRAISEVGKDIASILDLDELLQRVVNLLVEVFGYYYANVLMVDEEAQEIVVTASAGHTGRAFEGFRLKIGEQGITGWVAGSGEPLLANDVDKEPRYNFVEELADTKSELAVPIKLKGKVIGVLDVQSNEPGVFDEMDLSALTTLADQLAVAIENARLYQETHRLAITDGLTGLYNRRHFYDLLEREVETVKRYDGHVSLIMLDIDGFKTYNDIYGHLVGDALLRELAQLLARDIRKVDIAARYGGDEFVVFFPHTDKKQAVVLAERIRTSVEECEFWGEEVLPTGEASSRLSRTITVSVGVATCPEDAVEPEPLVNAADMALLEAKKYRNRVCTCGE